MNNINNPIINKSEKMEYIFKLYDFNVYNEEGLTECSSEDDGQHISKDNKTFLIQMFGLNEDGEEASIIVEDYHPFFYVKVPNEWGQTKKNEFFAHIKHKVGKYYENSITECKLIEKKKLYGFDAGRKHRFIEFKFANLSAFNKVKNLWYGEGINDDGEREYKLLKNGYQYQNYNLELYESNIPPLLRFFHIREISPSGWIALPIKKTREIKGVEKTTSCHYEYAINYKNIIPLNHMESRVPYKIMSFDIEASSSHGDFPVPIKSYKKLATNIVDYISKNNSICQDRKELTNSLKNIILAAFGYISLEDIELVYPKEPLRNRKDVEERTENWLKTKVKDRKDESTEHLIELLFEKTNKTFMKKSEEKEKETGEDENENENDDNNSDNEEDDLEEEIVNYSKGLKQDVQQYKNVNSTIVDILSDNNFDREGKISELIRSLRNNFPPLEGDKVTFIGSTFFKYGEKEPYLNHCIVLNSCNKLPSENTIIESYNTEREVLIAWRNLMHRENPHIVTGYNIFSFDYEFMFRRAQELNCVEEFLQLSKNNNELCVSTDFKNPNKLDIDRSSTTLASGTYELAIIKMNGRLQVDMLNWFRRTENLTSYKLDYVAGYFIGDDVKSLMHPENEEITKIYTTNMTGLQEESYVHFEEINHSSDYYKDGAKFKVIKINREEKWFAIEGYEEPKAKKVKWGLAKDDVTPKDIFRMTHEGPESRSVIAKYCIQDCNLVHYLFNKVDVMTDLIEMSKLCSVPMSFLIFRGQGIKLTSYVAKKCREKGVLMPVINKGSKNDGYEGAIVLQPKCGLYLDDPVCVGDFASLYPSSMLSENLCPSSKVWTQIYDLAGNLIDETGEKDEKTGLFKYDNIEGIEYVDIRFDTYRYIRKNPKARAEKIKSGYKLCRFAQPITNSIDGKEEKAIMPSILQELLKARKDTRKLIPQQTDEFMKNILDKRQLAYKVTANSLYGQLGAKTSTFYEPDIAASTTATGRLLLTYAKRVVEECYKDTDVETKYGLMNTKAEYVYGDSVANYTPIPVRHSVSREIQYYTIEQIADNFSVESSNIWKKCIENGKQEKEYCDLIYAETWTEKGWTTIYRVIRHRLASHKKMFRIVTPKGMVDVTDDHSLLQTNGKEISPKDVVIGTKLMHNPIQIFDNKNSSFNTLMRIFQTDENEKEMLNSKLDKTIGYFNNNSYETISFKISNSTEKVNHLLLAKMFHEANLRKYNIFFNILNDNSLYITVQKNPNKIIELESLTAIIYKEEIQYDGYVYDLTTENHHFAAGIGNMIVHNTDSVFFTFHLTDKETGEKVIGEKALELSIEIAQEATHNVSKFLKQPHDFEYEKTFMPFCLLSKKRYVSIKYEFDPKKGKRNEMGIVLKRRDNAPIVKDIYGGVIDILMKEKNIQMAIDYVHSCLQDLVDGKVPIEKLIITKSLRSFYKNPQGVAHKVLADRIAAREPGNKPSSGDRIPFVYIVTKQTNKKEKVLQGNKIETPTFIKENNLKIDYSFYITNQIMKPLSQLFGLVLEDIWTKQNKRGKILKFKKEIDTIRLEIEDFKKCEDKISKLKNKEVKALIFDKYLRDTDNAKSGNIAITKFFGQK